MDKGLDILLVEDNPDHLELILKVLREHPVAHGVYVATDGEEALDFLYQRGQFPNAPRPGLILLDINLPKIDGLEVLRHIKTDPGRKSIPVVMLTTSASRQEMMASYDLGVNSYIVKPVDFEQFTTAITTLKLYWLLFNRSLTE